jgi:hypothetical protein
MFCPEDSDKCLASSSISRQKPADNRQLTAVMAHR